MTTQYIQLLQLERSPHNVRKTAAPSADQELKASILAHGLMQNLVVTDSGNGVFTSQTIVTPIAAILDHPDFAGTLEIVATIPDGLTPPA